MSPGRCQFVLDSDEWEETHRVSCPLGGEELTDGAWQCPRMPVANERCPFHQRSGADAAAVRDERARQLRAAVRGDVDTGVLADEIASQDRERCVSQLVGACLPVLELEHVRLAARDTYPLDLRCAEIERLQFTGSAIGRGLDCRGLDATIVNLEETEVEGDCRFDGAAVAEDLCLSGATISARLTGRDAQFGAVEASTVTVRNSIDFREATVSDDVVLRGSEIAGRLRMRYARVDGTLDCQRARFTGDVPYEQIHQVSCKGLRTAGHIDFRGADIDGAVRLNEAAPSGDLTFANAELHSHLWAGAVDSENGRSGSTEVGGTIDLGEATIEGEVDLVGAGEGESALPPPSVGGAVSLAGTTIRGPLYLAPDLSNSPLAVVNLSGADVAAGRVSQATPDEPVCYDCARATLGNVRFVDEAGGPSLTHVRLLEVRFDGFEFAWHRSAIEADHWELHHTDVADAEAIARARHYPSGARYARDALTMLTAYDSVRAYLCSEGEEADGREKIGAHIEAETLAERAFGPTADLPDTETLTATELFPGPVADREFSRMGLTGRLLAFHDEGTTHPVVESLHTDGVTSALSRLAESIEEADGPVTTRAARDELASLAAAFATHLGSPDDHVPTLAQVETTYLRARNGADTVGDTTAAGEFYINELESRGDQHRARIGADGIIGPAYDWASNTLLRWTSGYGERPRQVFVLSTILILGFAGVFAALLREQPYGEPVGYLILSLESFITLVLGGAEDIPSGLRLVAQIEGFLGAFLIALFVFTLTRSIDR